MLTDRDQARAELRRAFNAVEDHDGGISRHYLDALVDSVLAHPDLVLRALGMQRVDVSGFQDWAWIKTWVEPPTDQGENDG